MLVGFTTHSFSLDSYCIQDFREPLSFLRQSVNFTKLSRQMWKRMINKTTLIKSLQLFHLSRNTVDEVHPPATKSRKWLKTSKMSFWKTWIIQMIQQCKRSEPTWVIDGESRYPFLITLNLQSIKSSDLHADAVLLKERATNMDLQVWKRGKLSFT